MCQATLCHKVEIYASNLPREETCPGIGFIFEDEKGHCFGPFLFIASVDEMTRFANKFVVTAAAAVNSAIAKDN